MKKYSGTKSKKIARSSLSRNNHKLNNRRKEEEKDERIELGSEIELYASLVKGHKVKDAARIRVSEIRNLKILEAGDAIPGGSNWVQMGPQAIPNGQSLSSTRLLVTGRLTGIAVHPSTPTTVYVSAARGGVWKTTDGGAHWTPLTDNQISLAMGALSLAPSAPDTLYAGTGEGNIYRLVTNSPLTSLNESYQGSGLLKTTDAGAHWTLQGSAEFSGAAFYAIAVHPTNANIAYAATTRGLYRTTNGGASWTLIGGGLPAVSSSIIACTDVKFDPSNGNNAWCAFWSSGIYECSNATAASPTWNLVNSGPTTNVGRFSLAVSPSSPSNVFALVTTASDNGSYKGVYRTIGGIGGTWSQLAYSGTTPTITSSRCVIIIDISTPDIVFFGGTSLHKVIRDPVTNSWSATEIGQSIHADHRTIAVHPTDHLTVYAGTDGGIYISNDAGANWSDRMNTGFCITQFEFIDQHPTRDAVVFSGTQDNGTEQFRTSEVFYHAADGDGAACAIDQTNPRNIIIEHYSISPERSTLGGRFGSFSSIASGLTGSSLFYPPFLLNPTNQNNLAFGATNVFIDNSQGTGGWPSSISLPGVTGRVSAIAYVNSNLLYAATSSGEVFRCVQSSGTWTATVIHSSPLPSRWIWDIAVSPSDSNTISVALAGFGTGHVWRGIVNGSGTAAAWSDISGTGMGRLPDVPAYALAIDPLNLQTIFVGNDVGVFRTTNDGNQWTPYREGLPNTAVYDLRIHSGYRLLRAATHGRGMWEREIDLSSSPDSVIFLRDNLMHTGRDSPPPSDVPAAFDDQLQHVVLGDHVYWWHCCDAKIDALEGSPPSYQMPISDVNYVVFESRLEHRNPQRGRTNRVYVQIHNRGISDANVNVKIMFADATSNLPDLPSDFWTAFPNNPSVPSQWTPIGAYQSASVKPGLPAVLEWDWTPPSSAAEHSCLLVVCDSLQDPMPAASKVFNIASLVRNERRVGLKNLHVVDPTIDGGDMLVIPFNMRPASNEDVFRIFGPKLKGWSVSIVLPSIKVRKEIVKGDVKPRKVPKGIMKIIMKKMMRTSDNTKDFEGAVIMYQITELTRKPAVITGIPYVRKSLPAFLILVPKQNVKEGALHLIQENGKQILGGNTFVIRTPRKLSGSERRT